MHQRRVFIIGQSLFAETLKQLLSSAAEVSIVGHASSVVNAISTFDFAMVDVVILTATTAVPIAEDVNQLLSIAPNIPIISTNLDENTVQVITSKRVDARLSELLSVLAKLPEISEFSDKSQQISNGGK